MFRCFAIIVLLTMTNVALAQEDFAEIDRDPASIPLTVKRNYPGSADEENLQVLKALPEAPLKTDARGIQKEVFKALYNQELKDDRPETVEE